MTNYLIYAQSTDGYVSSKTTANNFSALYAGTALAVDNTSTSATVGVDNTQGGSASAWQYFVSFDTSAIADTDEIVDAQLVMYNTGSTQQHARYSVEARPFDFGTSVTSADWRNTNGFTALGARRTQMLQAAGTNAQRFDYSGSDEFLATISKTGASRYVIATNHIANANNPGYGRHSAHFYTSRGPTGKKPYLLVKTMALTGLSSVAYASTQINADVSVSLRSNGAATPVLTLGYKLASVGGTVPTWASIGTLPTGTASGQFGVFDNENSVSLVSDPATGDFYVIGKDGSNKDSLRVHQYKKGTGNTWTVAGRAIQALPSWTGSINGVDAVWVPAKSPFIAVVGSRVQGWSLDNNFTSSNGAAFIATLSVANIKTSKSNSIILDQRDNPTWLAPFNSQTFTLYAQPSLGLLPIPSNATRITFGVYANGRARIVQTDVNGKFTSGANEQAKTDPKWGQTGKTRVLGINATTFALASPETVQGVAYLRVGFYNTAGQALGQSLLPTSLTYLGAWTNNWDIWYNQVTNNVRFEYIETTSSVKILNVSPVTYLYDTGAFTYSGLIGTPTTLRNVHNALPDERMIFMETSNVAKTFYDANDVNSDNAPTSPPLGVVQNFDSTTASSPLSWTFQDPNPSDVQSAFQVNVERVSDAVLVYDSGKVSSAAKALILAPNALANDTDYRWRVRTYDHFQKAVGAWSSYGFFSTTSTGTLSITDPAVDNQTGIETHDYPITWAYAQANGRTQTDYRVTVTATSDGSVLSDTGWVGSTTKGSVGDPYIITNMVSNIEYNITVQIKNSGAVLSPVSNRLITTYYANPMEPQPSYSLDDAAIELQVLTPDTTGDHPETVSNEVWRREVRPVYLSTSIGSVLDAAPTVAPYERVAVVGPGAIYTDYTVASERFYQYFVRAVSETGSTTDSDYLVAQAPALTGVWVHDPTDADNTIRNYTTGFVGRVETISINQTAVQYVGREHPVVETSRTEDLTVDLAAMIPYGTYQEDDVDWFRVAARNRRALCYRDNRSRKVFVFLGDLAITDKEYGTEVATTARVVDFSEEV